MRAKVLRAWKFITLNEDGTPLFDLPYFLPLVFVATLIYLLLSPSAFGQTAILLRKSNGHVIHEGIDLGWTELPVGTRVDIVQRNDDGTLLVESRENARLTVSSDLIRLLPQPVVPQPTARLADRTPVTENHETPRLPPSRAIGAVPQLKTEVDRFTGSQKVMLREPIKVTEDLEFNILFVIHEHDTDLSKSEVDLRFVRSGTNWRYLDYHPLRLLVDGNRINLGDLHHSGDVMEDATVLEQMSVWVPLKTFVGIANAQSVEAKLGITEFVIPYAARAGMRQLASDLAKTQPLVKSP